MTIMSGKDLEYKMYTLGDIGVIELLLLYRYKYDDNFFLDDSIPMAVSGAARLNEEVITTYAALDSTIKKCGFSEQQYEILKMIGEGYTYREIAKRLDLKYSAIRNRLKTIYKRIYKENEWLWRKSVYEYKMGLRNKSCSKCEEELPGTVEFYYTREDTEDGFYKVCKKCFQSSVKE